MFVIQKLDNGYYFHKNGKIILFDNPQEAEAFLQSFHQYTMGRALQESHGNPETLFTITSVLNLIRIVEKDFEEEPTCGIVYFKDLY